MSGFRQLAATPAAKPVSQPATAAKEESFFKRVFGSEKGKRDDEDGDGLTDPFELTAGTGSNNQDSDGDGIRDKDGKPLNILYQTTVNPIRQDFQALIKGWWNEIGVGVELKNIDASVFFGGDAGSPDTFQKFYADVEMYANNFDGTDPEPYLAQYMCDKIPGPDNQWQGENINRFCDPAYDALVKEMSATAEMGKRSELAKKMNDMLTKDSYVVVPLVDRGRLSAASTTLGGVVLNTWDTELWNAQDWYRIK